MIRAKLEPSARRPAFNDRTESEEIALVNQYPAAIALETDAVWRYGEVAIEAAG